MLIFSTASCMHGTVTEYSLVITCFFPSIACLAALQRHGECLALVNKRLETDDTSADLYIMRARLHQLFKNVCLQDIIDISF